ncbi:alpha/beta hydrolase [Undibacterium sp. TJN19]|uniref:alpha/beta hydrolase n=1 Tax=Undibacterium sp. TJN19 TaxID=3413055 RepID=UPI003BF02FBC
MKNRLRMATGVLLVTLAMQAQCHAQSKPLPQTCAEPVVIKTHGSSTTAFAYHASTEPSDASTNIVLLMLVGGSGHIALDDQACPGALKGNSLIRSLKLFEAQGFSTALPDAPSDWQGPDGLAGFRNSASHAEDIGLIIRHLRDRGHARVWLVGTSRGSISAVNAASRLSGQAAPDGLVLTSALMSGQASAKKPWVAQTVFDLPLENIHIPVLLLGHASDACERSPAGLMDKVSARIKSVRSQVVLLTGGPDQRVAGSLLACEGNSAHGYLGQESEMAAIISGFIRNEQAGLTPLSH